VELYAEEAKRIKGEILQSPFPSKRLITIKQPVGPAALITPWNFPSAMITRKVCIASILCAHGTNLYHAIIGSSLLHWLPAVLL
jgi:acyl-CoA reductase-like NAD-dependent aldehyde dehydrogenase